MKKYISMLVFMLLSSINGFAQILSDANFIYTASPQRAVQAGNYNTLSKSEINHSVTYFDGLSRPMQSIGIGQGSNKVNNNFLDWKNTWSIGNGSVPLFNQNGSTTENVRVNGVGPFGKNSVLWQCINDAASDADGGWNTSNIAIDKNVAYRYAVWVKRTGSQNGTTYHGTQNVVNLDGSANGNPYFWAGNLPALDTWYLMVGMIHPASYAGGYSGISGVYDTAGNKVISGTDFKWSSTTTLAYFRSYLYYSTDLNTSQYFYNPTVQKVDGTEASLSGLSADYEALDIVTHIGYDGYGRQEKEYLPYAVANSGNEYLKANALSATTVFYNQSKYENTANPYSQKLFESSPLNRVQRQAPPGNDWVLKPGLDDHCVKLDYQTNVLNEVKCYKVSTTLNSDRVQFPKLTNTADYPVGQLYKTVTKDENWIATDLKNKTTEEFKDKSGRVVLKRTFGNSMINGTLVNSDHNTYYIYDEYGNLTYVLPPLVDPAILISNQVVTSGYDDFSKFIDQYYFTGKSGGGGVTVSVTANVLKVVFSAGFTTSMLSGTPQDLPTTPCLLPDMYLGTILSGKYGVNIVGGKLKLSNLQGTAVTGFNETLTVNLPTNCTASVPVLNQTVLDNLCYQYRYDEYNRLVEKKLPGKGWEYIVYDKLDRPILTQDSNLSTSNKWLFTKYDVYNRPVYTGEYVNTTETTRAAVQTLSDTSTTLFETKQGVNTINGTTIYYSNIAFPNATDLNIFTISYYDDYGFDLNGADIEVSYGITPITNVKSLATGSKVRILGTSSWITNVIYYDAKGRAIYNYSKNDYLATTAKVKSNLDFVGKTIESTSSHTRSAVTTKIVDTFVYDHVGRLLSQKQKVNAQADEIILANSYDELGQLVSKAVGGKADQSRLQTIDYSYNIRGWLKNINNVDAIGSDLFAFRINYNSIVSGVTPLFNGNISQTQWKTANTDSSLKNYVYAYDALNRLTNGTDNLGKFSEILNYDKNGNITTLSRLGEIVGGVPSIGNTSDFGIMDNLAYIYDTGNRLQIVSDSANDTYGFKDDHIGSALDTTIDYTYDTNGNMLTDANKGITGMTYNYLNLPTQVTIGGANINYVYDATGVKQRKTVNGITTDYAGGFIYENGTMKFFPQAEGYVANNAGVFSYIYQYKDHLGNVRLSYGDGNNDGVVGTSEIVEENNYYPFGLKQKGYNNVTSSLGDATAQKYKYNGKELQDELGLNMYDYGARNYDPALGRWMNIDPLAEKTMDLYGYCYNNPINLTDPDGRAPYNEYNWDVSTNTTTKVSNKGGDKTDYINVIAGGKKQWTDVVDVRRTVTNIQTTSEIGFSFTERLPGEIHTMNFKPMSGAIEPMEFSSPLFPTAWAGKLLNGLGGVAENVIAKTGWKVGDEITNLTAKGNIPKWSTVRQRFWKNEALSSGSTYSETNLLRMQKGLAPQRINPVTGTMESMELHHHVVPQRDGGLFEFMKVWPDEHRALDPFRK